MKDKKSLSERDICTKYITPAITGAGWDIHTQIREEVSFTKGRIIVRGKLHARGKLKRADTVAVQRAVPNPVPARWNQSSRKNAVDRAGSVKPTNRPLVRSLRPFIGPCSPVGPVGRTVPA